ncbi:hypothetical protein II906_03400, partial [bacterium]|nr:hypothetical protein [bacterium]
QTDKAVYLDADLIVNIDISELFNQELGDYIIGAAYEECNKQYHSLVTKRSLGIDMKHNYFNSGVLLINCKKWRENNLTQKLKDTYDICKDRMIFHDQDLLNKFFSVNNYFPLDEKFNYFIQNKPTEARNLIFHYDGILKPWQFSQSLNTEIINYIDIWWDYAKETNCFDIIKDKCIYKDALSLRVARAIRAKHLLYKNQLNEKFEQISPV